MRFSVISMCTLSWTLASLLLGQSDCEVELDAELGVGPNGAYLFEASTDAMDASFQWNVNGSTLAEGFDNTLEWYDILGAPFWEVCVVMETTEGCVAEDCFTSADLVPACVDDDLIDPDMACFEIWAPVCGCDGVIYSNSCYATYVGGVTSFEEGECVSDPCIDETLIDPYAPCPFIWDPVCACDGVTYGNSCEAEHVGGVLWYTQGECGEEEPDAVMDLATMQIAAMPNPAQGWVQFSGWTEGTATVVWRDALGQTLGTFPNVVPNQPMELSPSWNGVVIAEIHGAGWTSRRVLVVR